MRSSGGSWADTAAIVANPLCRTFRRRHHQGARPLRVLPEPTAGGDRPRPLQPHLLHHLKEIVESAKESDGGDAAPVPVLDHDESQPPLASDRGHNLALTQWMLRDTCLPTMAGLAAPFTSNRVEQELHIRPVANADRGGFRTRAGAERFAHMRGPFGTTRKQGQNLLNLLRQDPDTLVLTPKPTVRLPG